MLEDAIGNIVMATTKSQTRIQGLDYTKQKLQYPRFVISIGSPQYFGNPSYSADYQSIDKKKGRMRLFKQFNMQITIDAIDSPDKDEAYTKLQELIGVLQADYDILFADAGIGNLVLNNFSNITDISVELETRIESRHRCVVTVNGTDTVYDQDIVKIQEVNPQIIEK
ncbi:MAG: phage neck terminator protein [Paraclostridium sp.]